MILNNADNIMCGSTNVNKIMCGSTKIWERIKNKFFGIHINTNNTASPIESVSYIGDAVGKTPSVMTPTYTLNTYIGVWSVDSDGYPYVYHDDWADAHRLCTQMTNISSGQTIVVNNPMIDEKTVQIWFFTLDSEGKRVLHTPEPVSLPYTFTSDTNTKFFMSIKYQDESEMTPFDMSYTLKEFFYGDWSNAFFMPKPCMLKYDGTVAYYLDKSNYAYREHTNYVSSSVFEYGGFYTGSEPDPAKRGQPKPIDGDEEQLRYIRDLTYYEIPVGITTLYGFVRTPIAVSGKGDLTLVYVYQYDANKSFLAQSWSGKDSGSSDIFYYKPNLPIPIDPATKYIRISYGQLRYDGAGSEMLPAIADPSAFNEQFIVSNTSILSDISNPDFEGNAMIEWPKIYYKLVQGEENGEGYIYYSDSKIDDTYNCWCNYDINNNIIDHFYTAIYNGSIINGKMRSLSGIELSSGGSNSTTNRTMSDNISLAEANNVNGNKDWYINTYSDQMLITGLLMLMQKRIDVNVSMSYGGLPITGNYTTGSLNSKEMFYGEVGNTTATKVFGMENWIGYYARWTAGIVQNEQDGVGLKYTRGTADGSNADDYNLWGEYYKVDSNKLMTHTNGHMSKMWFLSGGMYPSETVDPSTIPSESNDRYYQAGYVDNTNGDSGTIAFRSTGYMRFNPTLAYNNVGASLTCRPTHKS